MSLPVGEGTSPKTWQGWCSSLWGTGKMSQALFMPQWWWEVVVAHVRRRKVGLHAGTARELFLAGVHQYQAPSVPGLV